MEKKAIKPTTVETDQLKEPVINMEYCSSWGYSSKFVKVKELILMSYPKAKITGGYAKQSGAFEVTVNDVLVHSKLKGDGLVNISNPDEFIMKIKKVVE